MWKRVSVFVLQIHVPWLCMSICEYYCSDQAVSFEGRWEVCRVLIYDTILVLVILMCSIFSNLMLFNSGSV